MNLNNKQIAVLDTTKANNGQYQTHGLPYQLADAINAHMNKR